MQIGISHGRKDRHSSLLTAGACLLALVIALKNILNIPTERLTMDLVLSICILGGLATSYPIVTKRRISNRSPGHLDRRNRNGNHDYYCFTCHRTSGINTTIRVTRYNRIRYASSEQR